MGLTIPTKVVNFASPSKGHGFLFGGVLINYALSNVSTTPDRTL